MARQPEDSAGSRVLVLSDDVETLATVGRELTAMSVDAVPVATCGAALTYHHANLRLFVTSPTVSDGSGIACAAKLKARCWCRTLILSYPPVPNRIPPCVDVWLVMPPAPDELRRALERLLGLP
jgi:hypothetical protein